jgi:hypothetical protein
MSNVPTFHPEDFTALSDRLVDLFRAYEAAEGVRARYAVGFEVRTTADAVVLQMDMLRYRILAETSGEAPS